jgi:hypothetical protein
MIYDRAIAHVLRPLAEPLPPVMGDVVAFVNLRPKEHRILEFRGHHPEFWGKSRSVGIRGESLRRSQEQCHGPRDERRRAARKEGAAPEAGGQLECLSLQRSVRGRGPAASPPWPDREALGLAFSPLRE